MHRHRPYYVPPLGMLAKVFARLGHEVTVLTTALPDDGSGIFRDGDAEVHYLSGTLASRVDTAFWNASAERFDALHAERGFDLVLGRGNSTWGYFRQSRFAGQVPVICHEGTYPLWLHQLETRSESLAAALGPPVALLAALHRRRYRLCLQWAARVVCNSPALAGAFKRLYWWRPPRAEFIPYGFDTSTYVLPHSRPDATKTDSPPRLVFVGRLTWDKGVIEMVDILSRLRRRDAVLDLIGPVNDRVRAALIKRAALRGVTDRLRLPGPVHNSELPERLLGASAFVFPSTHPEGLSKVVMEAMAAGLPVVAYNLPGLDTLVVDGVTGWLVPPRDLGQAVDRIDALLADPDAAAGIGRAGRRRIDAEFAVGLIDARWSELLSSVVETDRITRSMSAAQKPRA